MSQYGPGDPPPSVRRRARKNRQAKPLAARPPRHMAHASEPKVHIPRRGAKPLQAQPPRSYAHASEPHVHIPRPQARPLQAKPPRSYTPAAEPGLETSTRSQRGAAVRAYDALTGKQKQVMLKHARAHPGTAVNRAILHIHAARTARNDELAKVRATTDFKGDQALAEAAGFRSTKTFKDALKSAEKAMRDYNITKAGEANKHNHFGETATQTLGVNPKIDPAKLRKSNLSPALWVLDQLDRPVHAIASAAKEDVKHIQEHGLGDYLLKGGGSKARHAALRGFENKDKTTFSDVLDQAGVHNKYVKAIGGFGLDVALDPTTYLTLGLGAPAKVAAKGAERAVLAAGRKAVKAGEMTQAELERKALHTAKEVYDAHPEHAKHIGLRVGVKGAPARAATKGGQRELMSKPVGSRVTHAARGAVRAATTESARERGTNLLDKVGSQFVHDYRPRDIHPVEHDFIRASARRYRAAREAADRHAEMRTRAINAAVKKAGMDSGDEAAVIHAIEAGAVRNLPETHRPIAEAIQHDLEQAGLAKIDRGLLHTLDIKGVAPHLPVEVTAADVANARAAARDATKAARQAEHEHALSLQGYGVARGRAAINSRQVGGSAAEREAEAADAIQAAADVAAGGHGMRQAGDALAESTARVHALRLGAEDAKKHLGLTLEQHEAYQSAAADALAHALKPEGYFPRHMKEEVFDPDHQRYAFPKSGNQRITGTSLKRRQRTQRLEHLTPDEQAQYDLRLAPGVGRNLQETGRALALSHAHDRLAALGHRMTADDVDRLLEDYPSEADRLLIRTEHGFTPATDKYGQVKAAELKRAIADGQEVIEVPRHVFDHAEMLRQRGRGARDLEQNVGLHAFDKVQGTIKTLQTAVNPGYHGTNLVGDSFSARLGGAQVRDFARARRLKRIEGAMDKAHKQLTPEESKLLKKAEQHSERYGDEHLTDAELVQEAIDSGAIRTGFAGHELPRLVQGKDLKTGGLRPMDRLQSLSEKREDFVRLATYHAARKRGLSPDEAAEWVSKHHFDYGDLTDAERNFARRAIPFYTFMARNTRLQVGAIGRAPGTLATYQKSREELAKAAEQDPDFAKTLQRYEQQGVPMMLPFQIDGNPVVLNAKLPLTDLNNLTPNPQVLGENLASRMTLLAKVPIEQIFKLNTFTKKPYSHHRVPAPAALGNPLVRDQVNAFFRHLGVDPEVKPIMDKRTGKMVPGWSWRIDELMRQIPGTNLAANMGTPTRSDHPQDAALAFGSWLAGPRATILDPKQVELNQLWEQHDKLDSRITDLKEGVIHKSGAKWHGKIGDLSKQLGKLEVKIAKTSKSMGVESPPFANRIGGKHKRKAAAKAFGAAGGGAHPFGASASGKPYGAGG